MDKFTDQERLTYLLEKREWLQSKGLDLTGKKAKEILDLMVAVQRNSGNNEGSK